MTRPQLIIGTGQYYLTRVFEPLGDEVDPLASESQIEGVVEAYVKALEEQTGLVGVFVVWSGNTVDMSEWPEGEAFGDWFAPLMAEHRVEVWD